jgi:hypothetical protein
MYRSLEHSIRMIVESGEETEHRVGVTVSDPNHNMVSKRKETILKHVRVKAKNEAHAHEKAKAHFRKKGYRVHDTISATIKEDINTTDKFVGNKQTDKPVPVIKPNNTQDAKTASLARSNAKERTSQTMGNNVEEGMADDAKEFALDVAPVIGTKRSYDRAKDAYNKGDYLGTAVHGGLTAVGAAGDLALASGVGSLAGAGLKGLAAKAGGYAAKKLAGRAAVTGAEKAAIGGAEKAAVGAGEKAALGAGEKAVAAGAGEKVAAAAEKGAAEKAAAEVEKDSVKSVAKNTAGQTIKNAVRNTMARMPMGAGGGMGSPLSHRRGELKHTSPVSVSRAKKHVVHEESGDAEREKIETTPRPSNKKRTDIDYVGRPNSSRSSLTRQSEVQRKVIDEDSKKKANLIKDTVKKKTIEQNLDNDRTKVFGDVIINPPVNFKNLNDVDQAS